MPSSYTPSLRLTKQGTGENDNTWGSIANTGVFELVDVSIAGVTSISVTTGSNITLTTANGSTDESRKAVLKLTGTPTANIQIIVPAVTKTYDVHASFSGAFTVEIVPTGGGDGVTFEAGQTGRIYCDGTDIFAIYLSSPMWNTGDIKMTKGTIAAALTANPGWALCDGNNGTPDLRNKFLIGAQEDAAGEAKTNVTGTLTTTGGSTTTSSDGGEVLNTSAVALTVGQLPKFSVPLGDRSNNHAYTNTAPFQGTPFNVASNNNTNPTGSESAFSKTVGNNETHLHSVTTTDHTHTAIPPYYALVFLMKL